MVIKLSQATVPLIMFAGAGFDSDLDWEADENEQEICGGEAGQVSVRRRLERFPAPTSQFGQKDSQPQRENVKFVRKTLFVQILLYMLLYLKSYYEYKILGSNFHI